ncbi:hypothetical protein C2E23DRAFT_862618 [Lenzites betulinus]|nr:hypothetical protein C2E23DRAFT_862618 [Lenzites betulinus]
MEQDPRSNWGPNDRADSDWECPECWTSLQVRTCKTKGKPNEGRNYVTCEGRDKNGKRMHALYFRYCNHALLERPTNPTNTPAPQPDGDKSIKQCAIAGGCRLHRGLTDYAMDSLGVQPASGHPFERSAPEVPFIPATVHRMSARAAMKRPACGSPRSPGEHRPIKSARNSYSVSSTYENDIHAAIQASLAAMAPPQSSGLWSGSSLLSSGSGSGSSSGSSSSLGSGLPSGSSLLSSGSSLGLLQASLAADSSCPTPLLRTASILPCLDRNHLGCDNCCDSDTGEDEDDEYLAALEASRLEAAARVDTSYADYLLSVKSSSLDRLRSGSPWGNLSDSGQTEFETLRDSTLANLAAIEALSPVLSSSEGSPYLNAFDREMLAAVRASIALMRSTSPSDSGSPTLADADRTIDANPHHDVIDLAIDDDSTPDLTFSASNSEGSQLSLARPQSSTDDVIDLTLDDDEAIVVVHVKAVQRRPRVKIEDVDIDLTLDDSDELAV